MTELENTPQCRFGDGPAIARFRTPRGCVCFPDDREQDLCMQHIVKDGMIGPDVEMIAYYIPGRWLDVDVPWREVRSAVKANGERCNERSGAMLK